MNAVELFTPFFSEGIANYILKKHKLGTPLTILEVAKGSITNMKAILSYYKAKFPNVYKTLRYYYLTDEYPFSSPPMRSVYFKPLSIPDEFAEKVQLYSIVVPPPSTPLLAGQGEMLVSQRLRLPHPHRRPELASSRQNPRSLRQQGRFIRPIRAVHRGSQRKGLRRALSVRVDRVLRIARYRTR